MMPPPRFAAWMVSLFAPPEQAESILGDLEEEFLLLGPRSGLASARRWYWRQSVRTSAHLLRSGFRDAPWSTALAVLGGFFLLRLAHWLPGQLLNAVTDRYLMYWSNHFHAYLWVLKALIPTYLLGTFLTGCCVALVTKKREMIATMAMALVLLAMIFVGSLSAMIMTGDANYLRSLFWASSDPLAIVMGGMLVGRLRSKSAPLPAA